MNHKQILEILEIDYYNPNPIRNGKKKCTICGYSKTPYRFCRNSNYSDNYHPWCMDCTVKINEDRKIQQSLARPKWLTKTQQNQILRLENEARKLSFATGERYSVAHKEPIQHWLVCGLDIPTNMYIETQKNNAKFSNWFLPYRLLENGTIEHIDLPLEFIKDAFDFNEKFNKRRNTKYQEKSQEKLAA